jgi:cysteinyl-tRNA synthetase
MERNPGRARADPLSCRVTAFAPPPDAVPAIRPMTLRIHNSLSRAIEPFVSIEANHVRMYVCGMTIYDLCHMGHARFLVAFDMVQRWLRASGYRVTYVRNITDIDDKIIRRALERGIPIRTLTEEMTAAMHADLAALGIEAPTVEPRATQHIAGMLEMIGVLEQKGLAYRSPNGDVNYAVRKFPGYGKLSGKSLDQLRAGERVAVLEGKDDPLDFVLWKAAKEAEPDDAKWPSPYGPGRPGWHIECSAMCKALLGTHFDIHGGGIDLQFPHHENEIAQSEAANAGPFVNFWVHNGHLMFDDEKMSKSLGNFFTIRDVLQRYDGETLRFFMLRAHYRSPVNFTDGNVDDARTALRRLYTALEGIDAPASALDWNRPAAKAFRAAMNDDFNTPQAIAVLFDLAAQINRSRDPAQAAELRALGGTLGLLQQSPRAYLQSGGTLDAAAIAERIEARAAAKRARDFELADRIRRELAGRGVVLQDSPDGTTWRKA